MRFAEVLTRPRTEVIVRTVGRDGVRVPRIAQDEVDGQFLRLEVAYVDNPQVVEARLVGKVELFAELRDGRSVHPTVVPRASVHVDVVVESHAAAAVALLQRSRVPDVTPVVVAEEQEHVVGHGEALVIVALHLGEDGPELGHLGGGTSVDFTDDGTLSFDDLGERLHVLLVVAFAHRYVTVAAHADGDEVVIRPVALQPVAEEAVQARLVRGIVPLPHLVTPTGILLVGAHHRLVVQRAHDDAVDGAALITAGNHETAVHGCDEVGLPLSADGRGVKLSCLHQPVDEGLLPSVPTRTDAGAGSSVCTSRGRMPVTRCTSCVRSPAARTTPYQSAEETRTEAARPSAARQKAPGANV